MDVGLPVMKLNLGLIPSSKHPSLSMNQTGMLRIIGEGGTMVCLGPIMATAQELSHCCSQPASQQWDRNGKQTSLWKRESWGAEFLGKTPGVCEDLL